MSSTVNGSFTSSSAAASEPWGRSAKQRKLQVSTFGERGEPRVIRTRAVHLQDSQNPTTERRVIERREEGVGVNVARTRGGAKQASRREDFRAGTVERSICRQGARLRALARRKARRVADDEIP